MEEAVDHSIYWERYCWWEKYPGDLDLAIDFPSTIKVNESTVGTLIVTHFSNTTLSIFVGLFLEDEFGYNSSIYEEVVDTVYPGEVWKVEFELNIICTGHYKLLDDR